MHANQHWLDKGNVRIKENEKIINPTTHIQYRKTTLLKRKEQRGSYKTENLEKGKVSHNMSFYY